MGVADVVIPGASTSQFYLTATASRVTSGGKPGCADAATTIYKFGHYAGGSTQTIALPVWRVDAHRGRHGRLDDHYGHHRRHRGDGVDHLDSYGYPNTGVAGGGTFASNRAHFRSAGAAAMIRHAARAAFEAEESGLSLDRAAGQRSTDVFVMVMVSTMFISDRSVSRRTRPRPPNSNAAAATSRTSSPRRSASPRRSPSRASRFQTLPSWPALARA